MIDDILISLITENLILNQTLSTSSENYKQETNQQVKAMQEKCAELRHAKESSMEIDLLIESQNENEKKRVELEKKFENELNENRQRVIICNGTNTREATNKLKFSINSVE